MWVRSSSSLLTARPYGLTRDGVTLHAARVRGRDDLSVFALDRTDAADRPRRRDRHVVRGRVRGTSDEASPSSSQNICARVPSGQPSVGITGELCSQPPEGVAENRFPNRSATSRWTVSPRVGSPVPSNTVLLGVWSDGRRPSPGRSSAEASSVTSFLRSSLYSDESSVSSGTG